MAKFYITEVVTLGMDKSFTGADWQISRDEDFTDLIVDIEKDTVNREYLHIALRDPVTGEIVDGYDGVYARVRYHYEDIMTPWHIANPCYIDEYLNNDGEET
jgi:hypothetical protein